MRKIKEVFQNGLFVSFITVLLKLIALVIGAFIAFNLYYIKNYYSRIEQEYLNNDNGIILDNSNQNQVYQNSEVNNDSHVENNSFYSRVIDENTSEHTLLQYAENACISGNYEAAVEIYSMEKLSESPVALNNMGYLYSQGLYSPQNIDIADDYYDKAIKVGSDKALDNKLAMHLNNRCEDIIEILKQGYEAGDSNTISFLNYAFFENYSDYEVEGLHKFAVWLLYDASLEEQENFISNLYEWNEEGNVFLTYSPRDTNLVKYIWYDDNSWVDVQNGIAGTTKCYKKYVLKCIGVELLNEGIERVTEELNND
ncbi:sel1 repeat family protein [Pseudobutyrivibrio xylanivorans]|uniref:Sel1 repeat family protein n=1 Tax=Pseudobutyrivibrio xylanivorans TaxID=185007 RepID=A0A5P6VUA5_PSEXY|nr:sel1 repeat family protein [Pseudobutyrivibrio xylanivorans]QFJ54804.1 sel1 repeat family protein [Pseudobutyrivibrio xylanivorans]